MNDFPQASSPPSRSLSSPENPAVAAKLAAIRAGLRPGQQELVDWTGGELAVSAVPGAGKSTGMAAGVAAAIARFGLWGTRQLAVVTFTRSAAASLKEKVRGYLKQHQLPPSGFFVSTLHSLALNIATRHPELSSIDLETVTLLQLERDPRSLFACIERWAIEHRDLYQQLLTGTGFDGEETERLRRQSVLTSELLPALIRTVVREAKSSGLSPAALLDLGRAVQQGRSPEADAVDYPVLEIASGLYEQYERMLTSRRAIDYDDTILAALRVLENPSARRRWQSRIFGVFEDEAQDSSPLQARLLEQLAIDPEAPHLRHLVRVGDPNQAINATFTPADPIFFRQFCQRCDRQGRLATIDRAGRSTPIILESANFTLDWINGHWQRDRYGGETPFRQQYIRTVAADDPQPNANPDPIGLGLELHRPATIDDTLERLATRIQTLLSDRPESSIAILVRTHERGTVVIERLAELSASLPVYDAAQRARNTRIPVEILQVLRFLDRPHSPGHLKALLALLATRQLCAKPQTDWPIEFPERFIYPTPLDAPPEDEARLAAHFCRSLLRARLDLPLSHAIGFIALALRYDAAELATAEKLADRVLRPGRDGQSLGAAIEALTEIVETERFEPIEVETSESQYVRRGTVTVMTMHKAKGLDWDAVFVPFLQADAIPGELYVPAACRFLGDIALPDVAKARLRRALHAELLQPESSESNDVGHAVDATLRDDWKLAERVKRAEEYRLLYVAMTRAKRLLWLSAAEQAPFTWSKPDSLQPQEACPAFLALCDRFPHLLDRA